MGAVGAAVGIGGAIVGGLMQKNESNKAARQNAAAAEENRRAAIIESMRERTLIRRDRARLAGSIKATAAASGVRLSGSVLRALEMNMEAGAEEEVVSLVSQHFRERGIQTSGALAAQQARSAGNAALFGGITQAAAIGAAQL